MSALGFRHELEKLINRESMENGSNTPDFILASYLFSCLKAYDLAVRAREHWFGRQGHSLKDPAQETVVGYVNPAPDAAAPAVPSGVFVEVCTRCHRPMRRQLMGTYICDCCP